MTTHNPLLRADQIAELYGLDVLQVTRWIEEGRLPSQPLPDGSVGVQVDALKNFLKNQGVLTVGEAPPQVKLLVVDDEAVVRQTLMRALAKSWPQAWVEEASTGLQAGRKMLQWVPDVVILDIKLPKMDAFDLLSVLRFEPRLAGTIVVAITGHDTPETRVKILEAGAHAYLPKPFDPMELIALVGNLLARRRGEV